MRMMRIAAVICGLIIMAQVGLLGYSLTRADSPQRLPTPIRPTTSPEFPLDLEGIMPFATGVAQGWSPDASLTRASMQIDWPQDKASGAVTQLPFGGWIFLTFLGSDGLLTMRIDRGSGIIVDTRILTIDDRFRDEFGSTPIDLSAASTTSGTAAAAAETAHGTTFRSACPDKRHTSWLSAQPDPATGNMAWHIEYQTQGDQSQPSMTMDVDWQTGQIENLANDNQPCA
jgi:hypothetical protein